MVNIVHYFVKNPSSIRKGLIFPSELPSIQYYTIGNFFLIGEKGSRLQEKYIMFAMHENKIIKLILTQDKKSVFSVNIINIGFFSFIAEDVTMSQYTGDNEEIKGLYILKRLRLLEAKLAEQVFKRHQFYFIGYSDKVNIDEL